jgi:PRTRC genetic system protein A
MPIPLYLKTDADMPRPADPEFYWLTRDGAFLCRNHPFFTSDVPTRRPIKALAAHEPHCVLHYPKVKASTLEFIVGFFARVYELHHSESVVLLVWDLENQRYKIHVPEQTATVWRSWAGSRSPLDVRYSVPILPAGHLLVGDIHCHGNMAAFASTTDRADERYRDGVHGIVGHVEDEPPDFHLELAIDGHRFALEKDDIFEGYRQRRRFVPRAWLEKVKVEVDSWTRPARREKTSFYGDA